MEGFSGPELLEQLQPRLEAAHPALIDFFAVQRAALPDLIYGSIDVRDAGWKVAAVDANAFPAGFNNIGSRGRRDLSQCLVAWVDREHPEAEHIHIWPENHTRNPGYVENLRVLSRMLSQKGRSVTIGSPELAGHAALEGHEGELMLSAVSLTTGGISVEGATPDLLLLNNDLTSGPLTGLGDLPVTPPQGMGWHRRRKSTHFRAAQPFIDEAAEIIGIDPWLLGTHWIVSEDKCLERETCLIELAAEVDECFGYIRGKYAEHGITGEPVMFVKNDSGTYGLGIIEIGSGEELLELSNRRLNRLTYGKGGQDAEDFLLQEGVPTALRWGDSVVEPCMYGAGGRVCAWFYRTNDRKGVMANLNSPSSRFHAPEDLEGDAEAAGLLERAEGWHGLVAELALLGMAAEMAELSR